jgi:hypothetical protein
MKEKMMSELTAEVIVDQHFPQDVQIAPEKRGSSPQERHTIGIRVGRRTANTWLFFLIGPNGALPNSISSPLMVEKRWR